MTNATANKPASAPANGEATAKPAAEPKDYTMVAISLPNDLAKTLEDAATNDKLMTGTLARRIVAEHFKYDIATFERSRRRGRAKAMSDEERAKAAKDRAATVKALLEKFNKGVITLTDDEVAAAAASMKPRVKKASTPEAK